MVKRSLLVGLAASFLIVAMTAGFALAANYGDTSNWVVGSTVYGYVGPDGIAKMANYRVTNGATLAATANITRAELRAAGYFGITPKGGIDLDLSDDVDLEAADVGTTWIFVTTSAGDSAQGPTFTDGATGVVVKTRNALAGTTCEDLGDLVACTAGAVELITCRTYCAD